MSVDIKLPRRWTIPAGVGSYYDSKEVHYAVGPILDVTEELSVDVIEYSAYDRLRQALEEIVSNEINDGAKALVCKDIARKALKA